MAGADYAAFRTGREERAFTWLSSGVDAVAGLVRAPHPHLIGGNFMRKRIAALAVGALALGGAGAVLAPAAGAAPGDPGCVAVGGSPQSSCQFTGTGDATSGGYVAGSDGWQIT